MDCLRYRALPAEAFIDAAMKDLGQALLDGKKSVEDPSFPQSRLPFWVLQFWNKMHWIVFAQPQWMKGLSWIDNNIKARVGGSSTTPWEQKLFEDARIQTPYRT